MTTSTSFSELLAKHTNHRLLTTDGKSLRCLDCTHTLLVPKTVLDASTYVRPLPRAEREPLPPAGTYERCAPLAREALREHLAKRRAEAVAAEDEQEAS